MRNWSRNAMTKAEITARNLSTYWWVVVSPEDIFVRILGRIRPKKKHSKKKTPMPKEHLNQILGTVALFFTFVTTNALIFAKILFQELLDLYMGCNLGTNWSPCLTRTLRNAFPTNSTTIESFPVTLQTEFDVSHLIWFVTYLFLGVEDNQIFVN